MVRYIHWVCLTLFIAAPIARAAPLVERTHLPFSARDVQELKSVHGYTDEQVQEFLGVLERLEVFADHANPSGEQHHDKSIRKIFYGAPFLTPSAARSVVGGEEYADYALQVIHEIDNLASNFFLRTRELSRVSNLIHTRQTTLGRLDESLRDPRLGQAERARLEAHKEQIQQELAALDQQKQRLMREGAEGASALPLSLRQEVAEDVIFHASRLGVEPTQEEQQDLRHPDAGRMTRGLASLRAHLAQGQFAIRQVIMEAGLTEPQRRMLSLYRQIRPDIDLRSLPITALHVRAVSQTYNRWTGDGQQSAVSRGPMMIQAINGQGEGGPCGGTRSCNVVVEYTSVGALSAKMARTGAVVLPVIFEADMSVAEPDFEGGVDCNFQAGWRSEGRLDVMDGAVVYDGDVYNHLRTSDTSTGQCRVDIRQGSMDSAMYHTLQRVRDNYIALHTERMQRAYQDRRQYERYLQEELRYHARRSQSRRGWFGDVVELFASGDTLAGTAIFLLGEAREFYWHTRIEDTESLSSFRFNEWISIRNTTRQKKIVFSGFPLACWKRASIGMDLTMVACPDSYVPSRDTETSRGEENCPEGASYEQCSDNVDHAPTDDNNVVGNPF